jgi:hypothetical protein
VCVWIKVLRRHVDISIADPCSDIFSRSIFIRITARGSWKNGACLSALGPILVALDRILNIHRSFKVTSLTDLATNGRCCVYFGSVFFCLILGIKIVLYCYYLCLWKNKLAKSLERSRRSLEAQSHARLPLFFYLYA